MFGQLVHNQQLERLRSQTQHRRSETSEGENTQQLNEAYVRQGKEMHKLKAMLKLADLKTQHKDQEVEELKQEIARPIPRLADASAKEALRMKSSYRKVLPGSKNDHRGLDHLLLNFMTCW